MSWFDIRVCVSTDSYASDTTTSDASPDRQIDGYDVDFDIFPSGSDSVESTVGVGSAVDAANGAYGYDKAWEDVQDMYAWPDLADSLSSEGGGTPGSELSHGTVVEHSLRHTSFVNPAVASSRVGPPVIPVSVRRSNPPPNTSWHRGNPAAARQAAEVKLEPVEVDLAAPIDHSMLEQLPPLPPMQPAQPAFLDTITLLPRLDVAMDDTDAGVTLDGSDAGASDEVDDAVCPFCQSAGPDSDREGKKTRMRRKRDAPRRKHRFGRWWRMFGYDGPMYCQRCSEVFRDHLMRQTSNSAQCSRANPCDDCSRILPHFAAASHDELWEKIDARSKANNNATKKRGKRRLPQAVFKTEPTSTLGDARLDAFSVPGTAWAEQSMKRSCLGGADVPPRSVTVLKATFSALAVVGIIAYGVTFGGSGRAASPTDAISPPPVPISAPLPCPYQRWETVWTGSTKPDGFVEVGGKCPLVLNAHGDGDLMAARCGDVSDAFQSAGYFCAPGDEPARKICRPDGTWSLPLRQPGALVQYRACSSCADEEIVPMPAFSGGGVDNCRPCSKCPGGRPPVTACTLESDTVCSPWSRVLHSEPPAPFPDAREYGSIWVVHNGSQEERGAAHNASTDILYLFGGLGEPGRSPIALPLNPDPRTYVADIEGFRNDMWRGVILPAEGGAANETNSTIHWTEVIQTFELLAPWPETRSHAMAFTSSVDGKPNGPLVPYIFGGFVISPHGRDVQSPDALRMGINCDGVVGLPRVCPPTTNRNGFGANDIWRFDIDANTWLLLGGTERAHQQSQLPTVEHLGEQDAVDRSWPMPRGQGTLMMSCDLQSVFEEQSCAGWLFGGSVGIDTLKVTTSSQRNALANAIHLAVPDPAPDVVGVPMNDLWYVDGGALSMALGRDDGDTSESFFYYHGPASKTYLNNAGTPLITSRSKHPPQSFDPDLQPDTLWPAARAGHASWLGAQGMVPDRTFTYVDMPQLYVFGGVGASPYVDRDSSSDVHGCLVMQDLWRYDPDMAVSPFDNPGSCKPGSPTPGCGGRWVQLSNGPDFPNAIVPLVDAAAAACHASLIAQLPWAKEKPAVAVVATGGRPLPGYGESQTAPSARSHATAWSTDTSHMWLFGGQYIATASGGSSRQVAPVLDDLWRLDIHKDSVSWHRVDHDSNDSAGWPAGRASADVFKLADGHMVVSGGQGWQGSEDETAVAWQDSWMLVPEGLR